MLSRATRRDNMYILGGLKPEDFIPIMPALAELTPERRASLPQGVLQFLADMQAQDDAAAAEDDQGQDA